MGPTFLQVPQAVVDCPRVAYLCLLANVSFAVSSRLKRLRVGAVSTVLCKLSWRGPGDRHFLGLGQAAVALRPSCFGKSAK